VEKSLGLALQHASPFHMALIGQSRSQPWTFAQVAFETSPLEVHELQQKRFKGWAQEEHAQPVNANTRRSENRVNSAKGQPSSRTMVHKTERKLQCKWKQGQGLQHQARSSKRTIQRGRATNNGTSISNDMLTRYSSISLSLSLPRSTFGPLRLSIVVGLGMVARRRLTHRLKRNVDGKQIDYWLEIH
jgi:hypothetical protein